MRNFHLAAASVALTSASSALFASSLSPVPAVVTLIGVIGANTVFTCSASGELLGRDVEWRWLATCIIIGFALATVGGEGHFFFAKDDWLGRDAVLADIVDRWTPVIYIFNDVEHLLRAPIGMYLLPGAIGHVFGLKAAHLALLAQTSLMLGFFFYAVTLVWPRRPLLFIVLFVLFSGLDTIPVLLKTGGASLLRYPAFWVEIGNYPANVNQLFWAPTHALPGWQFAAIALLYLRREIDLAALAAATLPLVLWSPLSIMGAVPIFLILVALSPREALSARFAASCVTAMGFLPILIYLRADAGAVPFGLQILEEGYFDSYLIFILFALTQIGFVAILWRRVDPWFRGALATSISLLLIFPFFDLGFMNDIAQRVSIVARAFLAFGFNALLIDLLVTGSVLALVPGVAIFLIGAVTPALEFYDSVTTPRFSISDCNLMTVYGKHNHDKYLSTYLARLDAFPAWLFRTPEGQEPLRRETRICWPDRVHGEKLFNWLKPENRIWLRTPSVQDMIDPTPPK